MWLYKKIDVIALEFLNFFNPKTPKFKGRTIGEFQKNNFQS
jgi:hypothetical protein